MTIRVGYGVILDQSRTDHIANAHGCVLYVQDGGLGLGCHCWKLEEVGYDGRLMSEDWDVEMRCRADIMGVVRPNIKT